MIDIPGMLMVGARCKSDGKTAFTRTLIERFGSQHDIVGVKVTTVDSFNTSHHPEVAGSERSAECMGPFYITEEKDAQSNTDTGQMLAAGAKRVLWLLALKSHLEKGVEALLDILGEGTVSVCESNRARTVMAPDVFIMIKGAKEKSWKPSATEVVEYADRIVLSDGSKKERYVAKVMRIGPPPRPDLEEGDIVMVSAYGLESMVSHSEFGPGMRLVNPKDLLWNFGKEDGDSQSNSPPAAKPPKG